MSPSHAVLAYNKPATLCIKTRCQQYIYCASCTENRSANHRHMDSTYVVVLKRQRMPQVAQVDCAKCRKSGFLSPSPNRNIHVVSTTPASRVELTPCLLPSIQEHRLLWTLLRPLLLLCPLLVVHRGYLPGEGAGASAGVAPSRTAGI